ncbi:MAG TPA: DUF2064 domain-containing protein [Chitinophagaceae bacterium]|nr:DUF2064 domain-containing protein [Chitinophagaceae bacterium]
MAIQQYNTALLLFSRRSEEESLAKNFLPYGSAGKNKALTQKIIERSILLAKNSGLPFFVWDEKLQHGDCFGERLANAIAAVFEKGFEKIVVIGNDCLTLNSVHIHQAVVALQSHEYVLAPTKKGGTYLIGLTQNNFNYKAFTSIRWQSSFVYNDLQELFLFSVFQLPLQDDVNNFEDLRKQVSLLIKADALRMYVVSIVASIKKYFPVFTNRIATFIFRFLFGLKAPPVFSFPL